MSESETPPGARRRSNGPRHEASEHVVLESANGERVEGWALNESRGGLRVVVDDEHALIEAAVYRVTVGEAPTRNGRVAWVKEEGGGQIAGVELFDEP
jgi:hypothetical protein